MFYSTRVSFLHEVFFKNINGPNLSLFLTILKHVTLTPFHQMINIELLILLFQNIFLTDLIYAETHRANRFTYNRMDVETIKKYNKCSRKTKT